MLTLQELVVMSQIPEVTGERPVRSPEVVTKATKALKADLKFSSAMAGAILREFLAQGLVEFNHVEGMLKTRHGLRKFRESVQHHASLATELVRVLGGNGALYL